MPLFKQSYLNKGSARKTLNILSAAVSYTCFGVGALILGFCLQLLRPIPWLSIATKQRWARWWIHKGCLTFIIIMRLLGLISYSYNFDSLKSRQLSGCIIVANHPTLIDAVFMFAKHKNLCCFVKSSLWNNFFTGAVAQIAGFIPNNSPASITQAATKLEQGDNLLIFPEGTRTVKDQEVIFKRGASNIAVITQAPIIPVLITCSDAVLKKGDKWYQVPNHRSIFTLTSTNELCVQECIDTNKPKPMQYRELTEFLQTYYRTWILQNLTVE